MTLSAMNIRTHMMMEQMRINAIHGTFQKWEDATKKYYQQGYDDGQTTKLYKELERLGANMEAVIDRVLELRDQYAHA